MSYLSAGKDFSGQYSNIYDGTEESPCSKPCLQTMVSFDMIYLDKSDCNKLHDVCLSVLTNVSHKNVGGHSLIIMA